MSQSSAATARVSEAEDDLAALEADAAELRAELEAEVAELTAEWDPTAIEVQVVSVTPRRTDVDVDTVSLAWLPYRRLVCDADGETKTLEVPAY